MDINSNDSYEEEFDSSKYSDILVKKSNNNTPFDIHSFNNFFEKIFISAFLYIIPSYIFLIVAWIIIYFILIRILLFIIIFPGKNSLVNF